MASEALLKGRYVAQFKKLGAISLAVTGATGIALYFGYYRKRLARVEAYNKSLTPEYLNALDKRVMRFAGLTTKEEFDNQEGPKRYLHMSSDEALEGYEVIKEKMSKHVTSMVNTTKKLKTVDSGIEEPMKLMFTYAMFGKDPKFYEFFQTSEQEVEAAAERIKKALAKYKSKH